MLSGPHNQEVKREARTPPRVPGEQFSRCLASSSDSTSRCCHLVVKMCLHVLECKYTNNNDTMIQQSETPAADLHQRLNENKDGVCSVRESCSPGAEA